MVPPSCCRVTPHICLWFCDFPGRSHLRMTLWGLLGNPALMLRDGGLCRVGRQLWSHSCLDPPDLTVPGLSTESPIPRQEAFPRDEYLHTECLVKRHTAHPLHVSLLCVEGAVSGQRQGTQSHQRHTGSQKRRQLGARRAYTFQPGVGGLGSAQNWWSHCMDVRLSHRSAS